MLPRGAAASLSYAALFLIAADTDFTQQLELTMNVITTLRSMLGLRSRCDE